jgi:CRISPR-associated protein Cmr4
MFEASQLVFYYAISPVHMGAGSAIGAIDSPIQREVHTQHPMFAGSGLKGALRHHFSRAWPRAEGDERKPHSLINRIFGPDTNASDFAGALSLSDAQLVALPVRSLKNGFAYVTSPLALARLQRLALQAGLPVPWSVPTVPENHALTSSPNLLTQRPGSNQTNQLVLEAFEFTAQTASDTSVALAAIAAWLADHALPGNAQKFFADKLRADLVLLHDTDFAHFARHAMVVEPHVRINDDTGTADDGGLFYVENLPPETLMVGLAQASVERYKKGSRDLQSEPLKSAEQVLTDVFVGPAPTLPGISGKLLQIGGDASTGRGLVLVQTTPSVR